jgi:TPR repeat protein
MRNFAKMDMEKNYPCCGKYICCGCVYSYRKSGNESKCPFCNSDRSGKTDEDQVAEIMKRVEANDAASIYVLGSSYYNFGVYGLQQDYAKSMELYARAADLGSSYAHNNLGVIYEGSNVKKAKFHFEAAAMAGHEVARLNLGCLERHFGNSERAIKHWMIAASAGDYNAMNSLQIVFKQGSLGRESINSTLAAYNNSCAEMRSEDRDAYIRTIIETI